MYNGNLDWSLTIRDVQYGPLMFQGPADLQTVMESVYGMQAAPLGDPNQPYDARAIFDSRPLNAFDGVFSAVLSVGPGEWPEPIEFTAPLGYRVVPREWTVSYDAPGTGINANSTVTILLQGSALPYNGPITIGPGTTSPIETFFLVEEGATFGMTGSNSNISVGSTNVYVNVRVNLIPVTLGQLPYSVQNRKAGT